MKYFVGMDLHSSNTYLSILDERGNRVYKAKEANFLPLILNALELFSRSIEGVVVESTFNWCWLVDSLMESGYKILPAPLNDLSVFCFIVSAALLTLYLGGMTIYK